MFKNGVGLFSEIFHYAWKPGWNVTDLQPEALEKVVNYGFHVHLQRPEPIFSSDAIVEFTFEKSDLIAVGYHSETGERQAVFKRLHLSEEEYNRAKNS